MLLLALSLLLDPFGGHARSDNASSHRPDDYTTSPGSESLTRPEPSKDPIDMHWILKWGAIGDSFTAGIGSGRLWDTSEEVKRCARYDRSYVAMIERIVGSSSLSFQWLACSGARSDDILKQAQKLETNMDLVVLTAGGNDLCLIDVLKDCIFVAYNEQKCESAITRAKTKAAYVLEPALEKILVELDRHMKPNTGVVVFASYAQFFHALETTSDECAKHNNWAFPAIGGPFQTLKVDRERRRQYDELVQITNAGIEKTIAEMKARGIKYRLRFANWDDWASDPEVSGQFCWPGSSGLYPDPNQPNLQFFKPETKKKVVHDEIKKRDDANQLQSEDHSGVNGSFYYHSLHDTSPNPATEVIHSLHGGDPIQYAGCEAAHDKRSWGSGLPDRYGKFFHPNEQGHLTIASLVLHKVIAARASVLDEAHPICNDEDRDYFQCRENRGGPLSRYVQSHLLDQTYKTYCEEVNPPKDEPSWKNERVFYKGTPEEHKYSISLLKGATQFNRQECITSFLRIIHGCDVGRPENPLSLKHGGIWKKGRYLYMLKAGHIRRPWPVARPGGTCEGWKKPLWARYTIRGRLWADLDHGQALRSSAKSCIGGGLTSWEFKYFDRPDQNDMEWEAQFSTPIWVLKRCFQNNKVFLNIGAPRIGCEGNDYPWPFNG
ncbi:SGNH hydrolase-type esterase domain-containing protein [Aspergillus bertholletiae]|uniref:SGNH hydrolase-type esterase domain-containing protein n=1 Tax=Aspergillus bertholletiae TaxID=1226010 RepID=A0A5N7AZ33_9EURO|nr:SGNH hydrolase-type esterase domain-containing protein [Aspergillus bertholletiae]